MDSPPAPDVIRWAMYNHVQAWVKACRKLSSYWSGFVIAISLQCMSGRLGYLLHSSLSC